MKKKKTRSRRRKRRYGTWKAAYTVLIILLALLIPLLSLLNRDAQKDLRPDSRAIPLPGAEEGFQMTEEACGVHAGLERTISFPCPDVREGDLILSVFFTHAYAEIYLDDELVFVMQENSRPHLGKTPGHYYARISLDASDTGKKVRILSWPVYQNMLFALPEIVISSSDNLLQQCFAKERVKILASLACVMAGIFYLLTAVLVSFSHSERNSIWYLGLFIMLFGLGRITDAELTAMLTSAGIIRADPRFLSFVSHTSFLVQPLLVVKFFSGSRRFSTIFRRMLSFEKIFILVMILLQLAGIRDLKENQMVIAINYAASISFILVLAMGSLIRDWKRGLIELLHYGYVIVMIGGIIDMAYYYTSGQRQITDYAPILVLLYCVLLGINELRKAILQRDRLRRTELALSEQRVATMMSQIQPHFIYNTMNTIYGLCSVDVEKARQAIHDFSWYLRKNFESLDKRVPISIEEELEHVRFFLSIQQTRFGEELQVVYDIACTDFRLPALSVQPLAENAVRHGIRKKVGPGTLTIRTRELPQHYEVIVEDDGAGFDTSILEPGKKAGRRADDTGRNQTIRNVRSRLRDMCGGTLEISSTPGEGTTAVIRVPKRWRKGQSYEDSDRG